MTMGIEEDLIARPHGKAEIRGRDPFSGLKFSAFIRSWLSARHTRGRFRMWSAQVQVEC